MTQTKTKKALLMSVLSMVLCVAMLVGMTFAWFTDTASTSVNKIQAGNLKVGLEYKDNNDEWKDATKTELQFKVDGAIPEEGTQILWEPGCRYELPELRVVNNGNLALKYKIAITGIKGNAKLNEVIDWTIKSGAEEYDLTAEHKLAAKTETSVSADEFIIKGEMKKDAGNEYQGLSIDGIAITVYATQDTVESDSYGPNYDADAKLTSVTSAEELATAVANGENIILDCNITLRDKLTINKDIVIMGDGYSFISDYPVEVKNANVTFKNVNFKSPTNGKNNASNLYAPGLTGKLVLDGCTFADTQWDSVQVTPKAGAEIVINNCTFTAEQAAQRFIHIEADYLSNADVKVTLTNNFFGSTANLSNSMIDIDYINLDGIDFGGNNVYTDENDIYVCGNSVQTTISSADAYKKLGSKLASTTEPLDKVGNTMIAKGKTATVNNQTSFENGTTIQGAGKGRSTLIAEKAKVTADDVTIKDMTIEGSGSAGTAGTLNINGNNTTIEDVDYKGDGNIAITVSTGNKNDGTVFKKTKITNAFRGIQFWSLSGDSVIDDCILDVAGYTFNIDAAVAGSTLTIKNSTLNGWTSYTNGIKLVSFEKCKLGLNNYEYLRPYSETKITNCEFTSAGYELNAGGTGVYTIEITDCTKNGTEITATNINDLLLDTAGWNPNATLIVNGIKVTV